MEMKKEYIVELREEEADELMNEHWVGELGRCKDCNHSEEWYGDKRRCFLWHESGIDVFEDGFCNYGKRK